MLGAENNMVGLDKPVSQAYSQIKLKGSQRRLSNFLCKEHLKIAVKMYR
jgi:hypothetical protein